MSVTVITGPPCSGKTTYAHQRKQPGDIVIDLDDFIEALGAERYSCTPADHIWHVAVAARTAAITAAIKRAGHGAAVWIIDSQPSDGHWHQYRRAGASIMALTAGPEELHARASADGRPAAWHAAIDQWHARHACSRRW